MKYSISYTNKKHIDAKAYLYLLDNDLYFAGDPYYYSMKNSQFLINQFNKQEFLVETFYKKIHIQE